MILSRLPIFRGIIVRLEDLKKIWNQNVMQAGSIMYYYY